MKKISIEEMVESLNKRFDLTEKEKLQFNRKLEEKRILRKTTEWNYWNEVQSLNNSVDLKYNSFCCMIGTSLDKTKVYPCYIHPKTLKYVEQSNPGSFEDFEILDVTFVKIDGGILRTECAFGGEPYGLDWDSVCDQFINSFSCGIGFFTSKKKMQSAYQKILNKEIRTKQSEINKLVKARDSFCS